MAIALTSNSVQSSVSSVSNASPSQPVKVSPKEQQATQQAVELKSNSVVVSISSDAGQINRAAAGISVVASSYTAKGLPANNTASNVESKSSSDAITELKNLKESGVSQSPESTQGSVIDNVSATAVTQADASEQNRQVNNQLAEQKGLEKKAVQEEQSTKVEAKRTLKAETAQQAQRQERTSAQIDKQTSEKKSQVYQDEQHAASRKIDIKA
ncbi:MAG: hypothetical protein V4525_11120 [Pseudomonadota bacterium]